jgi:hypothetical protein
VCEEHNFHFASLSSLNVSVYIRVAGCSIDDWGSVWGLIHSCGGITSDILTTTGRLVTY